MFKRHLHLAVFLSMSWLAHASASAGELTLFAHEDMQGREVTLRAVPATQPGRDGQSVGVLGIQGGRAQIARRRARLRHRASNAR